MKCFRLLAVNYLASAATIAYAQQPDRCGTDLLRQLAGPEGFATELAVDEAIRSALLQRGGGTPILTVPVVVHIVHDGGNENIPDAQVLQGIEHLNDAFANAGPYADADGVDIPIRFCLANSGPWQQTSTGITHTQSPLTDLTMELQDFELKSLVNWPSSSYLNIWVVRAINSTVNGTAVAGYATLPAVHASGSDGIVVEAQWFGAGPDQSKVLVHEAGHYLGLYHTFEGGCANNNCTVDGDQVCDTPPDQSVAPVCMPTANSCTSDSDDASAQNPFRATSLGGLGDVPDQFQNYMDYGLLSCQDRLTFGQGERMYAALSSIRESLLLTNSCPPPCGESSWMEIVPPTSATIGQVVQFGNMSTSASPHTFAWYVDGAFAGTTYALDWSFTSSGQHVVELRMLIVGGSCFLSEEALIMVECDAQATFSYAPMQPDVNENATFTCTTSSAQGVQWLINGAITATGSPFTIAFPEAAAYQVAVVVAGTGCTDTSAVALVPVGACTSGRNNNWVLAGGNIVNFNGGGPVSQAQGASEFFGAYEGLASISDAFGNLVLYCDNQTVFNGDHDPIVTGMNGGNSSSQAALILPHPGNAQQYFVITTDAVGGQQGGGMQYAIVDMSLNGGAGGALGINMVLMPQSSEKLTSATLCDGSGYWVIGHTPYGNEFHTFRLDASGLNTTPVISAVGAGITWPTLGCMRVSPKGDFLATANYQIPEGVRLRRFDNATGIVSGFADLGPIGNTGQYGVEFSADGSKLYVTNLDEFTYTLHTIHQWDLTSGDPQLVINSATEVGSGAFAGTMGSIQRGADGRIYILRDGVPWIDSINDPDAPGLACGYQEYAVPLNTNTFGFGISNQAPLLSDAAPVIHGPPLVCPGAENMAYTLSCTVVPPVWLHHGPNELVSSTPSSAVMSFLLAGTDTLVALFNGGCTGQTSDTLIITTSAPTVNLGPDTLVCSPADFTLDAGANAYSYSWQNGFPGRYFDVNAPGTYSVTVFGIGGCSASDQITISTFDGPWSFSLGPDILQCPNAAVWVGAPQGDYSAYQWSNGSTQDSAYLNPGAWLVLTLYDSLGCAASDTIQSFVATEINPTITGDTIICPGQVVVLSTNSAQPGFYNWNDGSANPTLTVYNPGIYWVQVFGCGWNFETDSITVTASPAPPIDLGPDSVHCPWQPVLLSTAHAAHTYYWSDGSTGNTLLANDPGTYWLTLVDTDGCYATDSITLGVCTGIATREEPGSFIAPNPNSGLFQLHLFEPPINGSALVVDAAGRKVAHLLGLNAGVNHLDLRHLASGAYSLQFSDSRGPHVLRYLRQ